MFLKLTKASLFFFIILLTPLIGSAQNYNKDIKRILDEAEVLFDRQEIDESLALYLKADSTLPKDAFISYQIGYLYGIKRLFPKALSYLQTAKEKNYKYDSLYFYLGKAYHLSHRFDEAIVAYEQFKKEVKPGAIKVAEVNHLIENCNNGKTLIKSPKEVTITNIGNTINSEFPDYLPLISADENTLFFTSRRDNSTGYKIDPEYHGYFEDIYIAHKDDGKWTKPVSVGRNINTDTHDACVALSADGQELFVYRGNINGGDLLMSDLHGTVWNKPTLLNTNINTESWEPGACVSTNENMIFFTSNRKGGLGGTDIYVSIKGADGEYGSAKLLGPQVNTPYNENSPFLQANGKTLYFSSQGHNSIGGFDIFSVDINPETGEVVSDPQNIGYPINTADDDVFFVWSADNKRAYFSSVREGGHGDRDIYVLERLVPETPLVLLEGKIKDCDNQKPLEAKIVVTDNTTKKPVGVFHSNSTTGKYVIILPQNANYGILIEVDAAHYMFYSKNIDNTQLSNFKQIMDNVCIEKIKSGHKMALKNVFFDVNKATLREISFTELRKLNSLLIENPSFKIRIIGHTDNDGKHELNMKLSDERAKSVAAYLIANGIDASRISTKGVGETEPSAPNDTEENKQLNRRTEIEFLE